jgi:integrase
MLEKRVTKDGKTRWRVLIRIKGHPPVSRTFGSKTKARQWEEKARTEIRENRFFEQLEAERHTFAEMIDRYLEQRLPRKSPVMQRHQRHQLLWWKEKIGHHRLSDVSPALIAQTRDELAAITVGSKAKKQRSGASVIRYLDDEERKRLLSACEKSRDLLLYPLVLTALSTGCRQGELLNLRWSEVDLERGVIRLLNTKNNERRAVPLHGPARDQVLALSKVRRIGDDRVFPLTSHQLRGPWQAALRQAEIEDFRFHDLRHTAASYLAMSGATLAEIAEVLGHKSLQMVRRYSHISEQHTSEVIERMTTKVFGGG